MNKLLLFTDGSVNTKSKIGFGAYLAIEEIDQPIETLKNKVNIKQFEDTNSTKLELQTVLWALNQIPAEKRKVIIYTDSQNIIGLLERRERLELSNYISKKNKLITNHLLYKEFYKLTDKLHCEFVKISGHKATIKKNELDKIFTIVDRASRNASRKHEI